MFRIASPTFVCLILLMSLLMGPSASARTIRVQDTCRDNWNGFKNTPEALFPDGDAIKRSDTAEELTRHVLGLAGIKRVIDVVSIPGFGNACAEISKDQTIRIFVDEDWLQKTSQGNYWVKLFIIAHEVGHHANLHPIGISRQNSFKVELDADYFAGSILRKANGNMDGIRALLNECPFASDPNLPDCNLRLVSIEKGYEETSSLLEKSILHEDLGFGAKAITSKIRVCEPASVVVYTEKSCRLQVIFPDERTGSLKYFELPQKMIGATVLAPGETRVIPVQCDDCPVLVANLPSERWNLHLHCYPTNSEVIGADELLAYTVSESEVQFQSANILIPTASKMAALARETIPPESIAVSMVTLPNPGARFDVNGNCILE